MEQRDRATSLRVVERPTRLPAVHRPPEALGPCVSRAVPLGSQPDCSYGTAVASYERLESASDPPRRAHVKVLLHFHIGWLAPIGQG